MHREFAAFSVMGGLLVALSLWLPGCSQPSTPSEDRAEAQTAPDVDADQQVAQEKPAAIAAEPAADPAPAEQPEPSDVKLARAESRIRPPEETPSEPEPPAPAEPNAAESEPRKLTIAEAPLPLDNVPAADLTMPGVSLTDQHAAMCLVGVGDKFPALELPDPAGQQHKLSELEGEKLTLVVFWNGQEPTALEELSDLARYLQPRFGDLGLAIVAIDTGDDPQLAAELAKQAGATYTILCDQDGQAFAQVAKAKIPRSYLLDSSGKVLWFDLEYSPTTLHDMVQAIRYSLTHH